MYNFKGGVVMNIKKVPDFIYTFINNQKESGYHLLATMYSIHFEYKNIDGEDWSQELSWIVDNEELFALTWIGTNL